MISVIDGILQQAAAMLIMWWNELHELPPAQLTAQLESATWFTQRLFVVCLGSLFLEAANMSDYAKLT